MNKMRMAGIGSALVLAVARTAGLPVAHIRSSDSNAARLGGVRAARMFRPLGAASPIAAANRRFAIICFASQCGSTDRVTGDRSRMQVQNFFAAHLHCSLFGRVAHCRDINRAMEEPITRTEGCDRLTPRWRRLRGHRVVQWTIGYRGRALHSGRVQSGRRSVRLAALRHPHSDIEMCRATGGGETGAASGTKAAPTFRMARAWRRTSSPLARSSTDRG